MRICLLLCIALSPASAWAQAPAPLCIDASHDSSYNARPISRHEVLARNAIGDRRGVRLGTSCIHIDRAAIVGLHSLTHCVAKGDEVAVSVPGGPREICRVTGVSQVAEDYAGTKYKN